MEDKNEKHVAYGCAIMVVAFFAMITLIVIFG